MIVDRVRLSAGRHADPFLLPWADRHPSMTVTPSEISSTEAELDPTGVGPDQIWIRRARPRLI